MLAYVQSVRVPMSRILLLSLSFGLVAATANGAGTPSAASSASGASGAAAFAAPVARYESAFAGYRRLGDQAVNDWRASNDVVGRIGGWQAYARESQQATKALSTDPDKSDTVSPASGHDAHHR